MAAAIIGGAGLEAAGSLIESKEQQRALEAEAEAAEQNAFMAREEGRINSERQQAEAQQVFGSMKAGYAASGVTSDSGSVLEVLRQSYTNAESDRLNILYGAEMEAVNYENRAQAARYAASQTKKMAGFRAFTSLFRGGAQAAIMKGG